MSNNSKIASSILLVLCCVTTGINVVAGRWMSVALAIGSLVGLLILLFAKKKLGFQLLCVCYVLSFLVGVSEGMTGATSLFAAVGMSFIGSFLVPAITYYFVRNESWF